MKRNNRFISICILAFAVIAGAFSVQSIASYAQTSAPAATSAAASTSPAVNQASTTVAAVVPVVQKPAVINDPTHLSIPNAHVDASIIPVGVTRTNNLDVPPNFVQVGWYEYGPKPGQVGNTVLDGHVDNGASIDGVFKHLRDLKPGDDIYVSGADGTQLHYKVDHSDVYLTAKFPSDVVFNQNDGLPTLKIITCHGTFVHSIGTYDQRLVVTAYLVN